MVEGVGRIKVLDQGWVELIDIMPSVGSADMAVITGARVSHLSESKGPDKDKKLLWYLLKHKHTSPLEQVQLKFRLNMPLVSWWQMTRHRTQSMNLQSGRYTEFEENCFYMPEVLRAQSSSNKQASDGVINELHNASLLERLKAHYDNSYQLYQDMLAAGTAKELARLALPAFSVYYMGITSINAHNLIHFLRLRLAEEAQYEIRVYARAMYEILRWEMPWTCEYLEQEEVTPWIQTDLKK